MLAPGHKSSRYHSLLRPEGPTRNEHSVAIALPFRPICSHDCSFNEGGQPWRNQMREYTVTRRGRSGRWMVLIEEKTHGEYLSEFAAIQDAVDAAYEDGRNGLASRVTVRATDGAESVRWVYGQDAYPYQEPTPLAAAVDGPSEG
jgi:hypothetical protein